MTVCVFASSSSRIDNEYALAATHLGTLLSKAGIGVVYGGGGIGLMGKLADSVIENGGTITGVIPLFMKNQGWGHSKVNRMVVTTDMGERKRLMFEMADAVIALPGGIGTLEELTEAITLKQLGLFKGPIILLNTLNFYGSLLNFLEEMVTGQFLRLEHKKIWEAVNTPEEALASLIKNETWHHNPLGIAKI